jgi:hypothetical protein
MPSSSPQVIVSRHAEEQYAARVGERLQAHAITRRVERDIAEGRVSRRRPRWLRDDGRAERKAWSLYAWPTGREFAFVLVEKADGVLVMATVLSRADAGAYARLRLDRTSRQRRVSIQRRALEG